MLQTSPKAVSNARKRIALLYVIRSAVKAIVQKNRAQIQRRPVASPMLANRVQEPPFIGGFLFLSLNLFHAKTQRLDEAQRRKSNLIREPWPRLRRGEKYQTTNSARNGFPGILNFFIFVSENIQDICMLQASPPFSISERLSF